MPYPPSYQRHTSFRQAENAGLALSTSDLDGEFNGIANTMQQLVQFLRLLAASDGTLQAQFSSFFSSFAGSQRFVATSGQTVFSTQIPWVPAMSAFNVFAYDNGVLIDPAGLSVAPYASGSQQLLRVTVPATTNGHVVTINAFDTNAYTMAERQVSTSGQTVFTSTTILWTAAMTNLTVEVYANGVRIDPSLITVANSVVGSLLQLTIPAQPLNTVVVMVAKAIGASIMQRLADTTSASSGANLVGLQDIAGVYNSVTVEGALYEVRWALTQLVNTLTGLNGLNAIWTAAGVTVAGGNATADFNLGGHKIVNMADGVANTDAVTVQQVATLTQDLSNLLALFIRKDGTVVYTADQSFGGHNITNLGMPAGTTATDGANRGYVDAETTRAEAAELVLTTADGENVKRNGTVKLTGHWTAGDPTDQIALKIAVPGGSTLAIYKNGSPTPLVFNTDWKFDISDPTKVQILAPQLPVLPTDTFVLKVTTGSSTVVLVQNTDWWLQFRQIKGVMPATDPNDVTTLAQVQALIVSGSSADIIVTSSGSVPLVNGATYAIEIVGGGAGGGSNLGWSAGLGFGGGGGAGDRVRDTFTAASTTGTATVGGVVGQNTNGQASSFSTTGFARTAAGGKKGGQRSGATQGAGGYGDPAGQPGDPTFGGGDGGLNPGSGGGAGGNPLNGISPGSGGGGGGSFGGGASGGSGAAGVIRLRRIA